MNGGAIHTGGANSIVVNFSGQLNGTVAADGTYSSATTWHLAGTMWVNVDSNLVAFGGTNGLPPSGEVLIIPAYTADTYDFQQITLSGTQNIVVGAHTSNTDAIVWPMEFSATNLPVYVKQPVNFSVVSP